MSEFLRDSNLADLILWICRSRSRFRIVGNSMLPLLKPGEEILINPKAYQHKHPQPGDLIIAQHPLQSNLRLVKRVIEVLADGSCFIIGDNPSESTDSRSFGHVSPQYLRGQVVSRFP